MGIQINIRRLCVWIVLCPVVVLVIWKFTNTPLWVAIVLAFISAPLNWIVLRKPDNSPRKFRLPIVNKDANDE